MKKLLVSILIVSLLLAVLVACAAKAQQLDEPEPEPVPAVDPIEPVAPEPPADPEPQQAPEPISESVPVEPVAEIEPANEPEPEPAPDDEFTFDDCNETMYATSGVNMRTGPGTGYDKVGQLSTGNSVTRVGVGTGAYENWSRCQLSDGSFVYVASSYLSSTKPVVQAAKPSGGSTSQSKPSGGSTSQSKPSGGGGTSSGGSGGTSEGSDDAARQHIEDIGGGLAGILTGFKVNPEDVGGVHDPNA